MANLKFELFEADVADNYQVGHGESATILNGVVVMAKLKISLSDNPEIFILQLQKIDGPNPENFKAVESVTKADILAWAEASMPEQQKKGMLDMLSSKVSAASVKVSSRTFE